MTLDLAQADGHIRRGRVVTLLGLAALAALYVMALQFTPPERFQGLAQKIFYIHPPAAYAMQLAFVMTGIASLIYLLLKDARFDRFAEASAEVGMVLAVIVVITGPIWGKPVWGAWWTWEPRLTFTVIEMLVFGGYFALRGAVRDPAERAKFAAVVGIMALVLVPFNHMTVYLFASQHPEPVVVQTGKPELPWVMLRSFITGFVVFTVLYMGMVMQRYGIGAKRDIREALDA
ncbi:MAG: cytochrome c biogenesis protein CcsA [Gemmatimonadales bacterium]|nr:cytochrome c biogenesis protein CcsA [Gemmatimonadales bacterium]MDZ4391274.1 cytochrome c biogenesis protein CcsA [Gemmatimonadales bacterium]